MPTKARRRNYRRKPKIYGTKPKFMPRNLAIKRSAQLSTKTFYFKKSGSINSDNAGQTSFIWTTQFNPIIPTNPKRMPIIADSELAAEMYTEYKVLAVKVRLFAANIGTEMGMVQIPPVTQPIAGYDRGNTITYIDQEIRPNEPLPGNIIEVMNLGSARMIPSRTEKFTRILYRKKGVPEWGCCDRNVPVGNRVPDPWAGGLFLLGNFARLNLGIRPLWFYSVTYKIIFRGRSFTP